MRKPINVFIILISVLILTGCDNKPDNMLSGYSHGEFVYLSYSGNEKIERILINKGDNVAAGQELVKIESFDAQNIFLRAEEKLSAESALLRNLESGERPEELDIIRSQGFVNGMVASHLLCHSGTINRHSLNGALLS